MTEHIKINKWFKVLPAVGFIFIGLLTRPHLNDWQFMWIFALSIFFSFKWITLLDALNGRKKVAKLWAAMYLLCWVGMDAARFLGDKTKSAIRPWLWTEVISKILVGFFLVFIATEKVYTENVLLGGWTGLIGLGLIIHFGIFHLLALIWNSIGINVRPIINFPLLATSLTDFWSKR